MGKDRTRTQLLAKKLDHKDDDDDHNKRKMIHREIEKQRRKDMATLHAGLRSLIPLEYIKGKRSVSDHMNGALIYIKSLQMRIEELGAKRDDLIRNSNSRGKESTSKSSETGAPSSCVVVQPCSSGIEIVFGSSRGSDGHDDGSPLSRVLKRLVEEGLTLVSCVTTKVSDLRLLHNIQAEVKDATCVNLAQLEQTLGETILSSE